MSSDADVSEKSFAAIDTGDLSRLADLAHQALRDYIARERGSRSDFGSKILCIALCQGAARHYVDKKNGVKDFDIFTFFAADAAKPFPPRRIARYDFGQSKFGRDPHDAGYVGRRVDVMGRSIACADGEEPIEAIHRYLEKPSTDTAWHLAQQAVVIIDPVQLRGRVVWPIEDAN